MPGHVGSGQNGAWFLNPNIVNQNYDHANGALDVRCSFIRIDALGFKQDVSMYYILYYAVMPSLQWTPNLCLGPKLFPTQRLF